MQAVRSMQAGDMKLDQSFAVVLQRAWRQAYLHLLIASGVAV